MILNVFDMLYLQVCCMYVFPFALGACGIELRMKTVRVDLLERI